MDALLDGRYLPLEERGRGASATVWRALDRDAGEEVALKIPLFGTGVRGARQILDESLTLSRLDHEGIIRLLSVECSSSGPLPPGTPYLVLEHSNADVPRRGALSGSFRSLSATAAQGLEALRHLHAARLLHGDLKPENVLLAETAAGPRVTLIDLGSSTPRGRSAGRHGGSAAWAAPELLLGGRAEESSDLYSLGRILHHLAGGEPPFDPEDPFGLSRWLLAPRPLPPVPGGLPPRLAGLLERLSCPRPSERPHSAQAALRLLDPRAPLPEPGAPPAQPRGVLRALRAGLRRAAAGEPVTLLRRVSRAPARRALLCRAAAEGVRAGFLPLRPGREGGGPTRPGDLLRLLRARGLALPARSWRRCPGDDGGPEDPGEAMARAARRAGRPLLLLIDAVPEDASVWQRTPVPPAALLLLLQRDLPAYNLGS